MRQPQDHFSGVAQNYASFRPTYPPQLAADLVAMAGGPTAVVYDMAAGSGQATLDLAAVAQTVFASDMAIKQIAALPVHPRIHPLVARAEASAVADRNIDLVTVAQAMHWFDVPAFQREVRRILRPQGIVAVWSYALLSGTPAVTAIINDLYHETGPWWPADRRHVDNHYAELPFEFTRIAYTPPAMTAAFTLPRLLGYLSTWSGVQRYQKDQQRDPVAERQAAFVAAWHGATQEPMTFAFDLTVLVGRVSA